MKITLLFYYFIAENVGRFRAATAPFRENVNNMETHFLKVSCGIGFYLFASSITNRLIVTTLFNNVLAEEDT